MTAKKQDLWINAAHFIAGQAGVVPLSLGIPGVGKTAVHEALSRKTSRNFFAYLLDQMLPEDLGGFPAVRDYKLADGSFIDVMKRVHDERFIRARHEPSILLFDELTNVGQSVQAAALQIINSGIPGAWIFAAANPVDQAANGCDLAPPMVNRLCILDWEVDRAAIMSGFEHGFVFPEPVIPVLPDNWHDFAPKHGQLLKGFLAQKISLLEAFPKNIEQATKPYPTPRSWTNAGKLLAACESVGAPRDVQVKAVYGCVGNGAGAEFFNWLDSQDLPDPEALLRDPVSLKLSKRGDLAVATLAGVLNAVRLDNTPERWEAAREVLNVAVEQSAEIAEAAKGPLWKIKPANHQPRDGEDGKQRRIGKKLQGAF